MKRSTLLLITFVAFGTYSGTTWAADSVYQCVGVKGEASFSERHCDPANAKISSTDAYSTDSYSTKKAQYAAHDVRLEQLKSEKVELRRKLMDLKREYYYMIAHVAAESEPALTQQYERQVLSLNAEITLLEKKQTLLVGQSFDELLQANAEN